MPCKESRIVVSHLPVGVSFALISARGIRLVAVVLPIYSVFDVAGISRLRARPEGFPLALWTASAPSGSYLAIMSVVFIWYTNSTQTKKLPIKTNKQECAPEGFQRAIADFVCFHCPLVAPAGAKSLRIITADTAPPSAAESPPTA